MDPTNIRTSNSTKTDLLDQINRQAASQAVGDIIDRHISNVIAINQHYPVNDPEDLLSDNIGRVRAIPANVASTVTQLHGQIRRIVQTVSEDIETRQYKSVEEAIAGMQLAYVDRQRAAQLVQADKRVHISARSLNLTVELFADLNKRILENLERTSSTQLLLGNAILVYELTDYVIKYIDGFSVDGIGDILQLYEEAKAKIADLRGQQEDLERLAQSPQVEKAVRDQVLDNIKQREQSILYLEDAWRKYVDEITSGQGDLLKIRDQVPTLTLMRENAKVQINLIQVVAMLQLLKRNMDALSSTILRLRDIKLRSITPNTLSALFGIA
jgi:hypothetical protein